MMPDLFVNLILAFIFGAAVGLERESSKHGEPHVGGIRSFAIMSLSGALAGIFVVHQYVAIGLAVVAGFLLLLISNYIIEGLHTKNFGITSELAAVSTFFLGLMVMMDIIPRHILVAFLVILVGILALKARTDQFVAGISKTEVHAFISYALIALVALPVLTDYDYKVKDIPVVAGLLSGLNIELGQFDDLDLINPRQIWFVVVLITGIDVVGYVLSRLVGDRNSYALTSFMAGFVSSTSATQSLALRSRNVSSVNHLVGAAVLANMASFVETLLLVGPLNPGWLVAIVPGVLIMIVTAGILSYYFLKKEEVHDATHPESTATQTIFSLVPALKFAALLIVIKIVTKICLIVFGHSGFVLSSVLGSFAGIDPITVNLADMAGETITFQFAFVTFLLINATNLMGKTAYAYFQGNRKFAWYFFLSALAVIASSLLGLIFV